MPTNWEQYDLDGILNVFTPINTGALTALAAVWRNRGEAIGQGRETLVTQTGSLAGNWKGKAATAFTDSATGAADRMEQWRVQAAVRAAGIDMAAMKISAAQQNLAILKAQRDQELAAVAQQGTFLNWSAVTEVLEIREKYDKAAREVAKDAANEIRRLAAWDSPGPYVGLHDVKPVTLVPNPGTNGPTSPPGIGGPGGGNGSGNGTTAPPNQRQPTTTSPDGLHQLDGRQVQTTSDPRQDGNPQTQTGPYENTVNQSPEQQVAPPQTDVPQVGQPPTLGQPPGTDVPAPPNLPGVPGASGVPQIVPFVPGSIGGGSRGLGSGGVGGGSGGVGGGSGGVGVGRSGAGAPTVSTDLLGRLAGAEGGGGGLLGGVRPPAGVGAGAPMIPPMVPPVAPPGGNGGALSGRQTRRTTRAGGAPRVIGQEPVTAPQSITGRPVDKKKAPPPRQQETEQPSAVTYSA